MTLLEAMSLQRLVIQAIAELDRGRISRKERRALAAMTLALKAVEAELDRVRNT